MSIATFKKIKVVEATKTKYVAKPTEAAIIHAESALGLTLPSSYREFVLKFGAGTLAGSFRLFAPLPKPYSFQGISVYDLVEEHNRVASALPSYKLKKRKTAFYLFCTDEGGAMYLWNKLESTKSAGVEYHIYQAIHADEIYSFAPSFEAFVERCCTRGRASEDQPPDGEEDQENWTFARFQVPPESY